MSDSIADKIQARIDAIVAYASQPENLYIPGNGWRPTEHEEFALWLAGYRYTFALSRHPDGQRFRVLTVMPVLARKAPSVSILVAMALAFGFTGYDPDSNVSPPWTVGPCPDGCCTIVLQELAVAEA